MKKILHCSKFQFDYNQINKMLTKEDNENFVVIPSDGSSLAVEKQSDKNLIAKLEDLGYRANASPFSFRISHLVFLQQFSAVEFVKFLQNNQTT